MGKNISGAEYPLSKIFSSDFDYVIPSYQRPYAWTIDQASELFDDLYDFYMLGKEETYFLGSIVLIKNESIPFAEVIDGQQRLTTLTILLALITSYFSDDLRTDFASYIREPGKASQGLKPKPRLTLRERDSVFFTKYVQSFDFDALLSIEPQTLDNESQKNIQANSRLLKDKLQTALHGDVEQLCRFGAFLVQRCFLVVVSTPSQESAFRVFSVLNNRGLDLLPSDIIKAEIIGRVAPERQDEFTEKWEELEVRTGRNGFNDLFGHIRMIYAKVKAKRALLEEFKEHVMNQVSTPEYLIEKILEPYAESYLIAKSQAYMSMKHAEEINYLLRWLNRIDNSDWLPVAILFLAQQKDQPEYVLWFFTKLERLAAYLHICAKNVNQRIERYAEVLSSLHHPHSLDKPSLHIELTATEIAEMKNILNGKIYELTARRRNYIILRLDSFLSDGAATYDPALLTIEHVLPQTVGEGSEWATLWPNIEDRKDWVHRIANLVPLTQKRNSKAQNFDFDTKKAAYFGGKRGVSSYILTTQVLKTNEWSPALVKQRQSDLLEIMVDKWSLRASS
ncbi:DUF262 domain-containing HNH endonuclease family protein [Acinetobacter sp.]|uniref:DUF262 domain-containing protein n=1 Tax=Acinetobacter sp. TaxID=472 RepID=UPI0031CEBC52